MAINALVKMDGSARHDELIQLVSFLLGKEEYGVEVLKVREIIRMTPITKMPNTAHHVEGIINLRGKVIPVIAMRKRFGLPESANNSHTRIIIMEVADGMTGFIVDGVSEVIRVRNTEIEPAPPLVQLDAANSEFITGIVNHAERLLVILDVDRMFSDDARNCLAA
jgi:purine-binding chemotaxis protein CheW